MVVVRATVVCGAGRVMVVVDVVAVDWTCGIWSLVIDFFFFQAEDGIRDHCVTGVQTCALPILDLGHHAKLEVDALVLEHALHRLADLWLVVLHNQIGRASCRERV